jgi:hypothetical protein
MEELRNKVAESGIITIDLEEFYPKGEICSFDIKEFLFMEMLLKEKDFRASLDQHDWEQYRGKQVAVFCSIDAIIPMWAYMLISSKLSGFASSIHEGTKEDVFKSTFIQNIQAIKENDYQDKRVIIKGCGDKEIPAFAYTEITNLLLPYVKSLMYGEACSAVPVFKRK